MAKELTQEWKNNFKSLWKYSQAVHQGKMACFQGSTRPRKHLLINDILKGMHGFVRDQNGKAIKGAKIQIADRTKIVHSNKDGAFWRLLLPGMRFQ